MRDLFGRYPGTRSYLTESGMLDVLGETPGPSGELRAPEILYETVDASNNIPFPPDFEDLARLHYLVRSRKVTTVLEFGVGKSTAVLNHALRANRAEYAEYVARNLRRSNAFELHSVDASDTWIEKTKQEYKANVSDVKFHHCPCHMGTFASRLCTYYEKLPAISPDLVYLDAPGLYCPTGAIRGLSTRHPDSLPMSADLLTVEHFLLPGTLIIVDGRTANARFLENNFQRKWAYFHDTKNDQHFFELQEAPLGALNKRQILFSLGRVW